MQSTPFRVRHGIIVETSSNTSTAIVANNQVLTGSASSTLVDLATAWNTTGNPTAIKLNVTNTASGANSALMDLQVSGVSKFKVVPSGNVGIGTTTPAAKFHVQGTAGSYVMFKDTLSYSTTSAGGLELSDYYSTNKYGIYVDNAGILSIGYNNTGNALVKIDVIGNLSSGGARLGWANYSYSPGFTFASDASSGMFSPGVGSLGFSTVGIERVRIDSTGNVGIGITVPTARLAIANGTSAISAHIYGTYTDGSNYERLNLTANSSGHYIIGQQAGTGSARPLYLGSNNATMVTVAASGNVGIGITSPTAKLHVFALDNVNTVAYLRHTNSSFGSGNYVTLAIDGYHPNGAADWKGIKITPTQATTAPMTGVDMSWNQIYNEARGVNVNIIKNTHSGGGAGIGVFSRIEATGTNDRAHEAIGGWFVSDKSAGALDPYTSYTVKIENRSTTSDTNLLGFYTDSTTQRGGFYYARSNNALALFGSNALKFNTNNSERMLITAAGLVGIGTSSPGVKLDVIGSGRFYSPSDNTGLTIGRQGDGIYYNGFGIWTAYDGTNLSFSVGFNYLGTYINNMGSTYFTQGGTLKMWLDVTGNFVVGNTAATAKLTLTNGTSPTNQHIYGTYTDVSNYERINLTANSSGHYIIGEEAGTGSPRNLFLGANNATAVTIDTAGRVGIGVTVPTRKTEILTGIGTGLPASANNFTLRHSSINGDSMLLNMGVSNVGKGGQNQGHAYIQATYWGGSNDNPIVLQPIAGGVVVGDNIAHDWKLVARGTLAVAANTNTAGAYGGKIAFPAQNYSGETAWIASIFDNANWSQGTGLAFGTISGADVAGSAGIERLRISSNGNVGIGTSTPSSALDVNSDTIRVRTAKTPASNTATGNQGDICWDANYIYVCTAANTWKRSSISTW